MLGISKAGFLFNFKSFGNGLKNVFTSVRCIFLLVTGIAIIAASAAGVLIYIPLLSRWTPAARVFGTLGGCLGMFIISLAYGMKNLTTNDPEQYQKKIDMAKKEGKEEMKETLQKEYEAKLKEVNQKRIIENLNSDVKAKINELEEKQKEIEKARFIVKDKEDEIKRLKLMNSKVSAIDATLQLVLFETEVKQLDIVEYYYDDNGNRKKRSEIDRPSGILFGRGFSITDPKDKERTYNQYYGIIEQEFELQGSVDLKKIKICEVNDNIYFSGIEPNTPKRIEAKNNHLLSQFRTVKFKKDVADPTVLNLIEDPFLKGEKDHVEEIKNRPKYELDDTMKKIIEKSAENYINLFLAPYGKPVVYLNEKEWQTLLDSQSLRDPRPLQDYFKYKIDRITQEGNEAKNEVTKLEIECSEVKRSLDR